MAKKITVEQFTQITQALLQVPTPENSQPWKIVTYTDKLEIFHQSKRAKLATFPDDLSVLGIGMLAETLSLSCSVIGVKADIHYDLKGRSDEKPWLTANLSIANAQISSDPLAKGLFLRHSDRRKYIGGSLNDAVFSELQQKMLDKSPAKLYFIDQYPKDYLNLLKNADLSVMLWDEMRKDMGLWVRFTDKQVASTQDGMPWRSLLRNKENWQHYVQSRAWWLSTKLDWFPEWLINLQSKFFDDSGDLTPAHFDDGAGLGCITVKSGYPNDLVEAGRLVLRTWLLLNLRGYGVQPLTNLVSITYPRQLGTFDLPKPLRYLVKDDYAILQNTYGFSENELPIFCFRTGLSMGSYPENAKTLRREDRVLNK